MTTVEKFLDRPDLSTGSDGSRSSRPSPGAPTTASAMPPAANPAPRETGPGLSQTSVASVPSVVPAASAPAAPIETASTEPPTTGALAGPPPSPEIPETARPAAAAEAAQCPSPKLQAVLADVAARFGAVTMVAGHQLTTANHLPGSSREKLHHDCMALDFRPERGRIDEIKAYLRSRPEIGGVDSYRDGVVHMDLGGTALAVRRAPTVAARRPEPAAQAIPAQRTPHSSAPLMRDDR